MYIGVLQIELLLSDAGSLKDKRRIIRSLIEKIKNKFNAAVAEIGRMDSWNHSQLGISCLSNEAGHCDSMLNSVINFIESNGSYQVIDIQTEIIPYS
ncbi:MAG: DUF503 domain-containing protein [Clostridiaceae bacterium]|nr:DUF503 domain-containing protein [Clostridiaceae bacterium]